MLCFWVLFCFVLPVGGGSFACSLVLPPICCIDSNCNNKQRPKLFVKIKFSLARRNVIVSMIFCSFDESMFKTDTGFLGLRLIYFKLIYDFFKHFGVLFKNETRRQCHELLCSYKAL